MESKTNTPTTAARPKTPKEMVNELIWTMEMHDALDIPETSLMALRVPNGWLYRDRMSGSSTFVPISGNESLPARRDVDMSACLTSGGEKLYDIQLCGQ